jgi:quercetin dioxygenase-like cupin family protein
MSQALGQTSSAVRDIDFLGMKVRAHDTGGGQVCEFSAAQGPIAPPHRHAWSETHLVLDGELEYMVDGEVQRVGAGGFLTIPGDSVHAINAVSDSVRWVEFTVPIGPADFFEEVSRTPGLNPADMDDMMRIGAIAARYDVELVLG